MSGDGNENIFDGLNDLTDCLHRALQRCKEQNDTGMVYVCGRCSVKFEVKPLPKPQPKPKEPMFPKHSEPWGNRNRQA